MEEKYRVKNTLGMFDLLKGILMIFMMVFHTNGIFDDVSGNLPKTVLIITLGILGEVAMPALLIVSGYGFRKADLKKCLNRLYKTLLIPYIVVILIIPVVFAIATYLQNGSVLYALKMTGLVLLGGILGVTSGPCWFLLALVISSVIFNELLWRFEGKKLFLASLIVTCAGWALTLIPVAILPWAISQGLISTTYLCIGYFAKKKKLFTSQENMGRMVALTVALIAVFVVFKMKDYDFGMAFSLYPFGPISIFTAGLLAFVDVYWILRLNRFTGKISSCLRSLGRNSLYILCIHAIEMVSFGDSVQLDMMETWQGPNWTRNLLFIATRMAIVIPITYGYVWVKGQFSKIDIEENKNKVLVKVGRRLLG